MNDLVCNLARHEFKTLFIEVLGWDHASGTVELETEDRRFTFSVIAQKRGLQALHCATDQHTVVNRARLRRLQEKLARAVHENVAIYSCEEPQKKQVWQWAVRLAGGRRLRHREHPFFSASPPGPLLGRLNRLKYTLDEESDASLLEALGRVRNVLDSDADLRLFVNRPQYAEKSDELAKAIENGGEEALREFITFHRPMVVWTVRPFEHLFGGDLEEAEQVGMMGLLHAARRFRRERGFQFSTYAVHCIEGYCKRNITNTRLPIRMGKLLTHYMGQPPSSNGEAE